MRRGHRWQLRVRSVGGVSSELMLQRLPGRVGAHSAVTRGFALAAARKALDVGAEVFEFGVLLASAQTAFETACLLPARTPER